MLGSVQKKNDYFVFLTFQEFFSWRLGSEKSERKIEDLGPDFLVLRIYTEMILENFLGVPQKMFTGKNGIKGIQGPVYVRCSCYMACPIYDSTFNTFAWLRMN